jgi:hypothetical protein
MRKENRNIVIILLAVFSACICAACVPLLITLGFGVGIGGLVIGEVRPMTQAGDAFLTAVSEGDYEQAYNLCSNSLQQELGSATGLKQIIERENRDYIPINWRFESMSMRSSDGETRGRVTYEDGARGTVELTYVNSRDAWLVSSFSFD